MPNFIQKIINRTPFKSKPKYKLGSTTKSDSLDHLEESVGPSLGRILGNGSELRRLMPTVRAVLSHEEDMSKVDEHNPTTADGKPNYVVDLATKTADFKKRIQDTKDKFLNGKTFEEFTQDKTAEEIQKIQKELNSVVERTLDEILPEAFAVVREASRRHDGRAHRPVQILGGLVMHQGRTAEMRTGEGKTLTNLLPAYLNALAGKPSLVVSTNDFLTREGANDAKSVLSRLGMTVGLVEDNVSLMAQDKDPVASKQEAYNADITYVTNGELGFDYLRDNQVQDPSKAVLRAPLEDTFAIIDEADSIMLDAARSALNLSASVPRETTLMLHAANAFVTNPLAPLAALKLKSRELYEKDKTQWVFTPESDDEFDRIDAIIQKSVQKIDKKTGVIVQKGITINGKVFTEEDLAIDRDNKTFRCKEGILEHFHDYITESGTVSLTDRGVDKAEKYFAVNAEHTNEWLPVNYYVRNALMAHTRYNKREDNDSQQLSSEEKGFEQNYIIQDGKIVLVDSLTGRPQANSRLQDGLHQAIEAKEGLEINPDGDRSASISYQNFMRKFRKLACATGTIKTSEREFQDIYSQSVVVVPPNAEPRRQDHEDILYKTKDAKYAAIAQKVLELHKTGQPILIGTTHVNESEKLAKAIEAAFVAAGQPLPANFNVLNAKNVHQESAIISQAGCFGAITISTNMAGRGTDIKLGGDPEKMALLKIQAVMKAQDEAFQGKTLESAPIELQKELKGLKIENFIKTGKYPNYLSACDALIAECKKIAEQSSGRFAVKGQETPLPTIEEHMHQKGEESMLSDYNALVAEYTKIAKAEKAQILALNNPTEKALEELKPKIEATLGKEISLEEARKIIDIESKKDNSTLYSEYKKLVASHQKGLFVVGSARHDSRRIDNQLIGRAGRSGDPGESQFFLSLEDDLITGHGNERLVSKLKDQFTTDASPLEETPKLRKLMTKLFNKAQDNVEAMHTAAREQALKMNEMFIRLQENMYAERQKILDLVLDSNVPEKTLSAGIAKQQAKHDVEESKLEKLQDKQRELSQKLAGLPKKKAQLSKKIRGASPAERDTIQKEIDELTAQMARGGTIQKEIDELKTQIEKQRAILQKAKIELETAKRAVEANYRQTVVQNQKKLKSTIHNMAKATVADMVEKTITKTHYIEHSVSKELLNPIVAKLPKDSTAKDWNWKQIEIDSHRTLGIDIPESLKKTAIEQGMNRVEFRKALKGLAEKTDIVSHISKIKSAEDWNWEQLAKDMKESFNVELPENFAEKAALQGMTPKELQSSLTELAEKALDSQERALGDTAFQTYRSSLLQSIDANWQTCLEDFPQLTRDANMRAIAQKDPALEVKIMGAAKWESTLSCMRANTIQHITHAPTPKPTVAGSEEAPAPNLARSLRRALSQTRLTSTPQPPTPVSQQGLGA